MSRDGSRPDRSSILVSGMPRSGTTWLARLLATASGTALTGREPMNARGRQYALGGTIPGWVSLSSLTTPQRRALRTAYAGLNPMVYSRYGRRQWAAPWPMTRVVVKDPFAMLSLPAVIEATGAEAILLYRHPGAAIASYRRMGWDPDLIELNGVIDRRAAEGLDAEHRVERLPAPGERNPAQAMGLFWKALYDMALNDLGRTQRVIVVAHEEVAGSGVPAGRRLFERLGLRWTEESQAEALGKDATGSEGPGAASRELHNLARNPKDVANSWRTHVSREELADVESVTADTRERLAAARLRLPDS